MKFPIFFILLFFPSTNLFSQNLRQKVDNDYGYPKVMYFDISKKVKKSNITERKSIDQVFRQAKGVNWKLEQHFEDDLGIQHSSYQMQYNELDVVYSRYKTHSNKNGQVKIANGDYYGVPHLSTEPKLSTKKAQLKALDFFQRENPKSQVNKVNSNRLVVLPKNGTYYLAHEFNIQSTSILANLTVYVDATNLTVLFSESEIHLADSIGKAVTINNDTVAVYTAYQNSKYISRTSIGENSIHLYDAKNRERRTGLGTDYFTDADNFWDTPSHKGAYGLLFGLKTTYDYFLSTFNRNSIDDNGVELNAYAHIGHASNRAFWDGNIFGFGDGDGIKYSSLASLDVIAHEYTHGITSHSANLIYNAESGALNESFSDIFGYTIRKKTNPSSSWLIGDQISFDQIALRSMKNPNSFGHPDTYKGDYWHTHPSDRYGVHTNSGVQNFWYYLLVEGGEGTNDLGTKYQVDGIGLEKAAAIAYRNLTVYLTPSSNYSDASRFSIQSAADLYGNCSPEVYAVLAAWKAVGIDNDYQKPLVTQLEVVDIDCSGSTITLINKSLNADSIKWEVSNGSISTENELVLQFPVSGSFDFSLTAYGNQYCTTPSIGQLFSAKIVQFEKPYHRKKLNCLPQKNDANKSYVLTDLSLGDFHNNAPRADSSYSDFSCIQFELNENVPDTFIIKTAVLDQYINVWIDLDTNQVFETSELIIENKYSNSHDDFFVINPNLIPVLDTSIHMRIMLSADKNIQPCSPLINASAEEYTLRIKSTETPPDVDFSADVTELTSVNDPVQFTAQIMRQTDSVLWYFEGGVPMYSTDDNPVVSYAAPEVYDVKLTAYNSFGTRNETKINYISVNADFKMCSGDVSHLNSGILYDNGGANNPYLNDTDCGFLIDPGCKKNLMIYIDNYDLQFKKDYLKIYDGYNAYAPLIANLTGKSIRLDTFKLKSGYAYIVLNSNNSINANGFKLYWDAIPNKTPLMGEIKGKDTLFNNHATTFSFDGKGTLYDYEWSVDGSTVATGSNYSYQSNISKNDTIALSVKSCTDTLKLIQPIFVNKPGVLTIEKRRDTIFTPNCNGLTEPFLMFKNEGDGPIIIDSIFVNKFKDTLTSFSHYTSTIASTQHHFKESAIDFSTDSIYFDIKINGDFSHQLKECNFSFGEDGMYNRRIEADYKVGTTVSTSLVVPTDNVKANIKNGALNFKFSNTRYVFVKGPSFHEINLYQPQKTKIPTLQRSNIVLKAQESISIPFDYLNLEVPTGVYNEQIIVQSNGSNLKDTIDAVFKVKGVDGIELTPNENFEISALVLDTLSYELEVVNNLDCGEIIIDTIYSTSDRISILNTIDQLDVLSKDTVYYQWSSKQKGTFSDTLFINTSILDTFFIYSSTVKLPVSIELTPLDIEIPCADTVLTLFPFTKNKNETIDVFFHAQNLFARKKLKITTDTLVKEFNFKAIIDSIKINIEGININHTDSLVLILETENRVLNLRNKALIEEVVYIPVNQLASFYLKFVGFGNPIDLTLSIDAYSTNYWLNYSTESITAHPATNEYPVQIEIPTVQDTTYTDSLFYEYKYKDTVIHYTTGVRVTVPNEIKKLDLIVLPDTLCTGDLTEGNPINNTIGGKFSVINNAFPIDFDQGSFSLNGVQSGNYEIVYTLNNECNVADTFDLHVADLPVISLADTFLFTKEPPLILHLPGYNLVVWSTGDSTESLPITQQNLTSGYNNFSVTVQNSIGCLATHPFVVLDESLVNSNNIKLKGISLYPNPVKEELFIELDQLNKEIMLINSLGEEVVKIKNNHPKKRIDMSFLPSGIYYLTVEGHHKRVKIMKYK